MSCSHNEQQLPSRGQDESLAVPLLRARVEACSWVQRPCNLGVSPWKTFALNVLGLKASCLNNGMKHSTLHVSPRNTRTYRTHTRPATRRHNIIQRFAVQRRAY